MNKKKSADLEALNRRHDEVYGELRRAIEERDRAVTLNLGAEVIARRSVRVSELDGELLAIDQRRQPLQREAEQRKPKWKGALTVGGGFAGTVAAKILLEWLLP